ncbi:MAG: acyl-CoA dehydratase activase [Candidatus Kapabacteria bacterium]|nr:acyl-CoA dehydratase activase [Candidatus Kapabacteria bacterium]
MNKSVIGVCLGASSVSFVMAEARDKTIKITKHLTVSHNGDPKTTFLNNLPLFSKDISNVVITGRKFRNLFNLTTISEPEAAEIAFAHINSKNENYGAIASLGGETFMVYTLDAVGKINNLITKNQCASGTGEFFLQQIRRMDISTEEVVEVARGVDPFKVSGRCSVFCKSDCTHALNKGVPKGEVASGLSQMMAEKVEELLKKVKSGKILCIGGVTQNLMVVDFLKKKNPDIEIPEEAIYFEAMGAALYGLNHKVITIKNVDEIFESQKSTFSFHKPLKEFEHKVQFKSFEHGKAEDGDKCILGLDVGSTTTKAVIIRWSDNKILGSIYLYTHGNPIEAAKKCYVELMRQIPEKINIVGLGTTGSGRQIAGLHALTDGVINEIVAHATAAIYFDPEVDTLFEIGGQDAKYTYIINKVPADYAMNEACSAGTGSFIEESAWESLAVKVGDIQDIAMRAINPPNFSDQCAAFISSDIKTAQQEGIEKDDIIAGLVYSICLNYVNRVKGNRQIGKKIFMQGGVCYNKAIPIAMAALTGTEIIVPPDPGLMGAFGVALEVKEKIELGLYEEKEFSLDNLANRAVTYKDPFICAGGREKCDLQCSVNLINVEGKTYPFGGSCNKYYNIRFKTNIHAEKYDYVKKRHILTYEKYAPAAELPESVKTVGINQSFHTHTAYPLYYNFFTKLGYKVVLSDKVEEEGLERELTSFCYPCQLSLGMFQDLVNKKPDYYFMPSILEMYVGDNEDTRIDRNATCVFLITEPYFIKQAFKEIDLENNFLAPKLNFAKGWDTQVDQFIEMGKQMGIRDENRIREAYRFATRMMIDYQTEMFATGAEFLKMIESDPDQMAVVLVGRPYNSFNDIANKGIPQKFASRGIYIIPYDMIDYRNEIIDENMYWEGGKKILKISQMIKKHPQLYATYISNFSCGPDSFILTQFRSIMGTKPSLTLELDGHTADAGVNTRIDAALDIIANYRKISFKIHDPHSDFKLSHIVYEGDIAYFQTGTGEKIPFTDKRVKILVPSMGDLAAPLFAAAMNSVGYHAEPMPEGNPEIMHHGRSVASGKECLPVIILAGSLIDYMENRYDGESYIAFFNVGSSGSCRIGQYPVMIEDVIKRKNYPRAASMVLTTDNGYAGMGGDFSLRGMQAILASDVLDDIRSAILANAVDPEAGMEVFATEFSKLLDCLSNRPNEFYKGLEELSFNIKSKVPARIPIEESKYIALVGEIFCRRDGFSHKWLNKKLAKKGFVVKDAYISEWIMYIDYLMKKGLIEPDSGMKDKVERSIRRFYMFNAEKKVKKALALSGYYHFQRTLIEPLLEHSKHIIPLTIKGESVLTLGVLMHETLDEYCGVINLGPFGCMPTRFSEAAIVPEANMEGKIRAKQITNPNYKLPEIYNGNMTIPFLTIESDGNSFPQVTEAKLETFALQAERTAQLMKEAHKEPGSAHRDKLNNKKPRNFFNITNVLKKANII